MDNDLLGYALAVEKAEAKARAAGMRALELLQLFDEHGDIPASYRSEVVALLTRIHDAQATIVRLVAQHNALEREGRH